MSGSPDRAARQSALPLPSRHSTFRKVHGMLTSELIIWLAVSPVVVLVLILLFGVLPDCMERKSRSTDRAAAGADMSELQERGSAYSSHAAPFRPYTVSTAREVASIHSRCHPARCSAKAAAISTLLAAGLPDRHGNRRRRVRA